MASTFTEISDHNEIDQIPYNSSGQVISPKHRPDGTQYLQETDINFLNRIRSPKPSKRAAADQYLNLHGYRDRHNT
jgi:hypothetical protein